MSASPPVPFPILVFGDSIQWGQGLRPGAPGAPSHKMAELVGLALAADPTVVSAWSGGAGLAVSVTRFAHSGATINGTLASSAAPVAPVPSSMPFPRGEFPAALPTIIDQVAGSVAVLSVATPPIAASAVKLVILDGGINDVGLFTSILNPLTGAATVAAQADAACGGTLTVPGATGLSGGSTTGQMTNLLTAVGKAYPGAVIVVTGYYDILSPFSDIVGLLFAVGFLAGSVTPEILIPGGWLASALTGSTVAGGAAAVVMGNCTTFRTTSNTSLASAVALASAAPGGSFSAGSLTAPRFIFAPCPFTPANALFSGGSNGADETAPTAPAFLWGFNPSLDAIGAVVDASIVAGSAVGGVLGFLFGGILGSAAGSSAGALAGAAGAIATVLPTLTPVDEVPLARTGPIGVCAGIAPGPLGVGALPCNLASVGHPNIEGDAAYAGSIAPPLITMFGTTLPALGIVGLVSVISSIPQGCLIMTATLDSPQIEQVDRIRWLRDQFIEHSRLGRRFFSGVSAEYYAFSPIVASRMRASPEFRDRVRSTMVLPFIAFVELLRAWVAESNMKSFEQMASDTLDASLDELRRFGIAREGIEVAAAEINRLAVHPPADASNPRSGVDGCDAGLEELVDFFNRVADREVASDGIFVETLLLRPVKIYWSLLRDRAACVTWQQIDSRLRAAMDEWLCAAGLLAAPADVSLDDILADAQLLCELLGAKRLAAPSIEALLSAAGAGPDRSNISQKSEDAS